MQIGGEGLQATDSLVDGLHLLADIAGGLANVIDGGVEGEKIGLGSDVLDGLDDGGDLTGGQVGGVVRLSWSIPWTASFVLRFLLRMVWGEMPPSR